MKLCWFPQWCLEMHCSFRSVTPWALATLLWSPRWDTTTHLSPCSIRLKNKAIEKRTDSSTEGQLISRLNSSSQGESIFRLDSDELLRVLVEESALTVSHADRFPVLSLMMSLAMVVFVVFLIFAQFTKPSWGHFHLTRQQNVPI